LRAYLQSTDIIDWHIPLVKAKAKELATGYELTLDIVKSCYKFVRDEIQHTGDYGLSVVTCRASEALFSKTGFSFSKSHLLAALLRANHIPAGLCYQRVRNKDSKSGFSLHSLNAVFLPKYGWYRLDARGNNDSINASFNPPKEYLAFTTCEQGEADLPKIWTDPLSTVIEVIQKRESAEDLLHYPPDIQIIAIPKKATTLS
jgi:transglutaminase-like putative cysteine protease